MDTETRFLQEIGPDTRAELLRAMTAPEEERAARISRLSSRRNANAQLVTELLTELEVNEPARLRLIGDPVVAGIGDHLIPVPVSSGYLPMLGRDSPVCATLVRFAPGGGLPGSTRMLK
jgi:hypothetical protein